MSEKEKIKTASNNVIDIMSTLGKQFIDEAIEQGEPILNIISQLSKKEEPCKETEDNIFNKDICHKINDTSENIKIYSKKKIEDLTLEDCLVIIKQKQKYNKK